MSGMDFRKLRDCCDKLTERKGLKMTANTSEYDFLITRESPLHPVMIEPQNEPARIWIAANLSVADWQESDSGIVIDRRYFDDIYAAIAQEGLTTNLEPVDD